MVEAPIFHVNGDDPEAVVHAAKVATEYRQKFKKDVVIDIFCYRRFGHNEGDEPMFTQPKMYSKIKDQKTTLETYSQKLIREGLLTPEELSKQKQEFQNHLNNEFEAGKNYKPNKADWLDGKWAGLKKVDKENYQRGKTSIGTALFKSLGETLTTLPNNLNIHRTVLRMIQNKEAALTKGKGIDWATAEALAFGSLLHEGFSVRLSGQDSKRGTFSQRHSAIIDQSTEDRFYPLYNITKNSFDFGTAKTGGKNKIDQNIRFEVIDSMLSEYAVLGYEYGYSLAEPNCLTIWEAQFGDFVNGAQIMIDQFISSGEKKWLRMSGLVMLLPHGYEGQGPEHSSARLERFLQACAEENWIIANCTTPANYFHILRRQMQRDFRKPLVIMTPKSLLRNKLAVSSIEDFTNGSSFHRILFDDAETNGEIKLHRDDKIERVIICSGKVYYDLYTKRNLESIKHSYIMRLEQFYPFPTKSMIKELGRFKNAKIIWCQEEPKNQGGWSFVEPILEWTLSQINHRSKRAIFVGRASSASPATGLAKQHLDQQEKLVNEALGI
jgi:2-oxoglutarate dehydrogenase E1 component